MLHRTHRHRESPMFCPPEPNLWRIALLCSLGSALGCAGGCMDEKSHEPRSRTEGVLISTPVPPAAPDAGTSAAAAQDVTPEIADAGGDAAAPWPGPFFTVTSGSTGSYAQPVADRALKVGYARNGGRIPVLPEKVVNDACRSGWYEGVQGGFICSSEGTVDQEDPRARLRATPPNLDAVLPYPYARNARNGTPLYNSVPSDDQIAAYEAP